VHWCSSEPGRAVYSDQVAPLTPGIYVLALSLLFAADVRADSTAAQILDEMRRLDRELTGKQDATPELRDLARKLAAASPDAATVAEATRILLRHPYWHFDDLGGSMRGEIQALGPAAHPVLRQTILDWPSWIAVEKTAASLMMAVELLPPPYDDVLERAFDEMAREVLRSPPRFPSAHRLLLHVLARRQSSDPQWVTDALWSLRGDHRIVQEMLPRAPGRQPGSVDSPDVIRSLWQRLQAAREPVDPGTQRAIWLAMSAVAPRELLDSRVAPRDAAQAVVLSETADRLNDTAARREVAARILGGPAREEPGALLEAARQQLTLDEPSQALQTTTSAAVATLDRQQFGTAHLLRGLAKQALGDLAGAAADFDVARRAPRDGHTRYPNPWGYPFKLDAVGALQERAAAAAKLPLPVRIHGYAFPSGTTLGDRGISSRSVDQLVGSRLRVRVKELPRSVGGWSVAITDTSSGRAVVEATVADERYALNTVELRGTDLIFQRGQWTERWDLAGLREGAPPSPD
jgi:hypothetical protein